MTNEIKMALEHVQSFYPEVTHLFLNKDGQWFFCDDGFCGPTFIGNEINIPLLEMAVESVDRLPNAFSL